MRQDTERFGRGSIEWPNRDNQDACPAKYRLVYILNALYLAQTEGNLFSYYVL